MKQHDYEQDMTKLRLEYDKGYDDMNITSSAKNIGSVSNKDVKFL